MQGVFVIPRALANTTSPGQGFGGPQTNVYAALNELPVWYHLKDDRQAGPMTASAMRERAARGELQPADLVWKDGMPDWVAASGVQEFFTAGRPTPARGAAPPPLPPMAAPFVPSGPAPMPTVGIGNSLVICLATSPGTISSTTANAPASATARASAMTSSASLPRPWTR